MDVKKPSCEICCWSTYYLKAVGDPNACQAFKPVNKWEAVRKVIFLCSSCVGHDDYFEGLRK